MLFAYVWVHLLPATLSPVSTFSRPNAVSSLALLSMTDERRTCSGQPLGRSGGFACHRAGRKVKADIVSPCRRIEVFAVCMLIAEPCEPGHARPSTSAGRRELRAGVDRNMGERWSAVW